MPITTTSPPPAEDLPGHRILAINRGEEGGVPQVFRVEISKDLPLNYLFSQVVKDHRTPSAKIVIRALIDGYDRLIAPSVEREIRTELFEKASEGAIALFSENLKNLADERRRSKGKTVLGLDPGYRTGCKLAVVDPTGKVLDTAVIYPTKPREDIPRLGHGYVRRLIDRYHVDVVAIGNGTASKESEIFISDTIRDYGGRVKYAMVSEAGASVYSASKLAADEFPDFDVTQRSAVSIARRLAGPFGGIGENRPQIHRSGAVSARYEARTAG